MKRIVILISGRGSNMEAIIKASLPLEVAAVISNRPYAKGLDTAKAAGIATVALDHKAFPTREAFDAALASQIEALAPDWIVLAGFMRVLGADFIARFRNRLLNIHPSLLPSYPGLHTHQRAIEDGVRIHGCTVHVVTPELDHGPILAQAAVAVSERDDEHSLAARVLREEHRIYPAVLRALCEGRLAIGEDGTVTASVHGSGGERVEPPMPSPLTYPAL